MDGTADEGAAEHTSGLGVDAEGTATIEKQWLDFKKGKDVLHGRTLCF